MIDDWAEQCARNNAGFARLLVCQALAYKNAPRSRIAAPAAESSREDFGVLTVSVQAKKGLVTKTDWQAFSSAL